jgi:hypothetical protein
MYGQATGAGETNQIASFSTSQIAAPANRWTGRNRQGWSHADFDRLAESFNQTLDPEQRIQQRVRMAQLLSQELPSIMLHYNLNPTVHLAALIDRKLRQAAAIQKVVEVLSGLDIREVLCPDPGAKKISIRWNGRPSAADYDTAKQGVERLGLSVAAE